MPSWAPDPTVGTETPYSPLPSICAGRQECRQVEVVGASGGELWQGSHWVLHAVGSEAADWVLGRQLCHGAGGLHGPACCCCHSSWWPWWLTWSAGVLTSPHSEGRWGKTRGKQRQACVFLRWFLGALAFVYRTHTHTHTHTHTLLKCVLWERVEYPHCICYLHPGLLECEVFSFLYFCLILPYMNLKNKVNELALSLFFNDLFV